MCVSFELPFCFKIALRQATTHVDTRFVRAISRFKILQAAVHVWLFVRLFVLGLVLRASRAASKKRKFFVVEVVVVWLLKTSCVSVASF